MKPQFGQQILVKNVEYKISWKSALCKCRYFMWTVWQTWQS